MVRRGSQSARRGRGPQAGPSRRVAQTRLTLARFTLACTTLTVGATVLTTRSEAGGALLAPSVIAARFAAQPIDLIDVPAVPAVANPAAWLTCAVRVRRPSVVADTLVKMVRLACRTRVGSRLGP